MIAFEDQISWQGFLERQRNREAVAEEEIGHLHTIQGGRNLHKSKQEKKRKKKLKKLFADPGIQVDTMVRSTVGREEEEIRFILAIRNRTCLVKH